MDRLENGLSKEDNFESWDIISDDYEDMQDFEIIKVLHDVDVPLLETEPCDDKTILNNHNNNTTNNNNNNNSNNNNNNAFRKDTFTTDDSGETTDEGYDYEDTKKSKQGIKKEHNNFVEAQASKLSTKKELKFKRKQTLPEKVILKKKDENKNKIKKCINKKSRPFLNSANLGALLTAFGLSLIFLNSSDKTQTCPAEQETKNISETILDAINDTKLWTDESENAFDDEKLLERFLPANINKTILERKNFKSKLLKRIDRKIKQQIRGCDVKPLKKEKKIATKTNTAKIDMIGPLTKDDEFYANNSSSTSSKPITYRDAVLSNKNKEESSDSSKISPANVIDYNVSKTKADMMNKFLDTDVKNFIETPHDLQIQNVKTEENYPENKYKVINYELKKKPNCSSIYRDFIKAELLFKKILNNCYDIPKPKTPTDLAYNVENKINILTEDNINLSNIIEEQESLLRQIQDKIEYKKEILQKRSQQKNILQKRLKFANWMKQKREHDDQKAPKVNLAEKILNNIVTTNLQDNKQQHLNADAFTSKNISKSSTDIATRYELKYPANTSANANEDKYKNKSEEETAVYLKRKLYLLKKHEDLQRNMEIKKRKLIDEEHMKASKLPEKADPKRAWAKKKTEF